ncbi:hypothetical protein N0V93_003252 [Gnomoniopsis smithogilvyi]|uniref:GXWXG protein n=1 Tax=Gnomoniopsis smithogilvyi TaxID=1191159 RepID=A0A9W8YWA7_9PEZI|nr:hypothetical protein N0V93_003252 [Gnomoniopsis smithogilvyi]
MAKTSLVINANNMSRPEQQFNDLVKTEGHIDEAVVASVYDQLKPVEPQQLIGKWVGGSFDTGHPTHETLKDFKWAGKDYRSIDDVDPIMIYTDDGERKWLESYGHARLRKVEFRGVVTTAMVYDNFPILDPFRYVSEDVVMGAMDSKLEPNAGTYFFYLTRIKA